MVKQPSLGEALAKATPPKHQMRAFTTAVEFIEAGGTREEWLQVFDLVAARYVAPSVATPKAATPVLSPEVDLRSRARVRERIVKSAFDRYLTHSGRMWGNVAYDELDSLKDDGDFAARIKEHIGQLPASERQKKIRDLLNERDFVQIANKAKIKPSRPN